MIGLITDPPSSVGVILPWLNDSANQSYGSSANPSICYLQSTTITENGLVPAYITQTTNQSG